MKPKLYYYPGNANLAAHILLEEAGREHELVLVDRARREQKSAEYMRLNPNGTIPALVSGELVLFEAAAICLHIVDEHPAARLGPLPGTPERAHLYKWLSYLSTSVQTAYMAFRYPEQYVALPAGAEASSAALLDAVRASAAERADRAFDVIERSLGETGPFLLGSEYSACDAYLYMVAWWSKKLPRPPARLPRVRACLNAVAARAATQRACAAEGIEVYTPGADPHIARC